MLNSATYSTIDWRATGVYLKVPMETGVAPKVMLLTQLQNSTKVQNPRRNS